MNPGEGFEAAAARAYAQGIHPLTFTETVLAVIVAYETGRRLDDPYAEQLARRLIAFMLNSGWTMPGNQGEGPVN